MLFYPRYHLDQSSLLGRKTLLAKPMVMDVYQDYILVTYRPFDVHIFHVKLSGELTPSRTPDLQVKKKNYLILWLVVNLQSFELHNESENCDGTFILHAFLSDKMTNSFLQYESSLS